MSPSTQASSGASCRAVSIIDRRDRRPRIDAPAGQLPRHPAGPAPGVEDRRRIPPHDELGLAVHVGARCRPAGRIVPGRSGRPTVTRISGPHGHRESCGSWRHPAGGSRAAGTWGYRGRPWPRAAGRNGRGSSGPRHGPATVRSSPPSCRTGRCRPSRPGAARPRTGETENADQLELARASPTGWRSGTGPGGRSAGRCRGRNRGRCRSAGAATAWSLGRSRWTRAARSNAGPRRG